MNLAAKYRPQTFEDVMEQSAVVDILKKICSEKELTNRNFLFIGPAGTGKAQPLYSKVLTPEGFITMGEVKVGTEVITHTGAKAKVSGVYPQGVRPIYEITLSDRSSIRVSDEHLNLVRIYNIVSKEHTNTVVNTGELMSLFYQPKDYVLYIDSPTGITFPDEAAIPESRQIVSISKIGEEECQCIMVDHPDHTYISDSFIPTHNTTLGRIISKHLNGGSSNGIIEIDAASHSGADAARDLTNQARAYPVGTAWKCFIVDECVTGDTEILTHKGWKRIDSLSENDKVAQYTEYGKIQFVDKWEYVKKEYSGDMYDVAFRNGKRHVLMSPHHVQPVRMHTSRKIREQYIQDCKFTQSTEVLVAGEGTGNNELLSPLDRLYIACQADGYCNKNYARAYWEMHLRIPEKIARTEELLKAAGIDYKVYGQDDVSITFYHEFPRDKKLASYFDLDMGVDRARDFISEILRWDGSTKSGYPGYYSCTDKDNVDFVSAVLTLCGYSGTVDVTYSNNPNHKDVWSVNWFYQDYRTGQAVSKTKVENFSGTIYCVKVPSQMIVLRSQGFAFVSGNCHAISSQGWQVLLKTLEENPAKSIFILCTTNPEKIPATILSRVQTFRLSKISIDGITARLKHICDNEIAEGVELTYEDDALRYIAKLGNGGMRDSIQLLDRAIAYSKSITIDNLATALDLPNYDNYFDLLQGVAKKDNVEIVRIINDVYDSGTNFVKWFEGFHSFVCQIVKYIYLKDITKTMIPAYYQDKISKYGANHAVLCLRLANVLITLNHSLKSTNYLQEVAITYLCSSAKR